MMNLIHYLDSVLVPSSIFLLVGYHTYLWHCLKNKPFKTTSGFNGSRRKLWLLDMKEGDEKKGMLAVQSLRNTLMATVFIASIAIIVNLSVAALINNTYNASHLLNSTIFGSQSGKIYVLKFSLASAFLSVSFLCNSMALGYLTDANFLINASGEFSSSADYTQTIFQRGFLLNFIGNRVLCISFPVLMWTFGPVPVALSSLALVFVSYQLDFSDKNLPSCT
ncbi:hypothetical protein K2173_008175 [Erythroxylum novogranatense]|uniref:DUF599 domain-containing protein n=1 Tax=Erythroxylum novogranatense TaxID=1862640 RepID=A0AAV8U8W5_9ROSI|nr:hypothetical protein K2173_008175 [Erythroxylum novogranatense]